MPTYYHELNSRSPFLGRPGYADGPAKVQRILDIIPFRYMVGHRRMSALSFHSRWRNVCRRTPLMSIEPQPEVRQAPLRDRIHRSRSHGHQSHVGRTKPLRPGARLPSASGLFRSVGRVCPGKSRLRGHRPVRGLDDYHLEASPPEAARGAPPVRARPSWSHGDTVPHQPAFWSLTIRSRCFCMQPQTIHDKSRIRSVPSVLEAGCPEEGRRPWPQLWRPTTALKIIKEFFQ